MATLYISEFAAMPILVTGQSGQLGSLPALAKQTVAIAAGSAQSGALNAATSYVRIHTDAICSVAYGVNPTATATDMRLAQNQTEYFAVPRGQSAVFAVIVNT